MDSIVLLALSLSIILLLYYDYHQALESGNAIGSISIMRESAKVATELEEVEVKVFVENSSHRDVALSEVVDLVPEFLFLSEKPSAAVVLPKGTTAMFSYRVKPLLPGSYVFRDIEVRAFGPLGFFTTQTRVTFPTTITVLPYYGSMGLSLKSVEKLWGLIIRGKATGGMYDLADFREYTPGDDYRKIVWKAYARTGRVYVREDFGEVTARVLVILDVRAWDWSIGNPPNTLASIELRTLRSLVQSLARYSVPVDLAVCCSATAKVVRSATEDVAKALIDVFSYVTPHCYCSSHMGVYASVPTYMGRQASDYGAVLLVANPISLATENPTRFADLIEVFGSRLRVLIPRFEYEHYVDREDLEKLYSIISSILERAGGGLEPIEESMVLQYTKGGRK
ncbi:MAG: DUF58 domain-containing protein [Sulfolobales archaeon]